jgi:hypothetical protein
MTWLVLAQQLVDGSTGGTFERLGVAGILVAAAAYLLRYFIGVIAVKDKELAAQTQQFITMTREFSDVTKDAAHAMEGMKEAVQEVGHSMDRLTGEFRSTLGDTIVRAARESVQGAVQIATQTRQTGGGR